MASAMTSNSLQIERHPRQGLFDWFEMRRSIDFEPPYQRKGGIWSNYDQALLIDTVINRYDIPKFYLSDFGRRSSSLQSDKFVYAIIDGKQRLQAIFDFMQNKYPLNADCVWRFDPSAKIGGLTYGVLGDKFPKIASLIDQYEIDVMSVSTDDPEDINRIFKRLNKGKSLTGAEVRNAALGPVADMIRVVARHEFFVEAVAFSTLRANDYNAAAKILLFEFSGGPTSTKKRDLDDFVADDSHDRDGIESAGLKCLSYLDFMFQVFASHDALLRSSGQIPVYYWMVRQLPRDSFAYVRPFLIGFEKRRSKNRNLQTLGMLGHVDPRLTRYDALNRNTNDVGSHRARVEILLEWFVEWLGGQPVNAELREQVDGALLRYREETFPKNPLLD